MGVRFPLVDTLDKAAVVLMLVAVAFVTLVAHAPFSIGLLMGALLMAAYGWRTGQQDLIGIAAFLPAFGLLAWAANYGVYRITPHVIDSALLRTADPRATTPKIPRTERIKGSAPCMRKLPI